MRFLYKIPLHWSGIHDYSEFEITPLNCPRSSHEGMLCSMEYRKAVGKQRKQWTKSGNQNFLSMPYQPKKPKQKTTKPQLQFFVLHGAKFYMYFITFILYMSNAFSQCQNFIFCSTDIDTRKKENQKGLFGQTGKKPDSLSKVEVNVKC